MTTPPDKTGDKGPERIQVDIDHGFIYPEINSGRPERPIYVLSDLYDALQSANAELVKQVEQLKGEIASIKEMDAEMYDLQSDLQKERDRYRKLLAGVDSLLVMADRSEAWKKERDKFLSRIRQSLSPTTNKAEGG